MLAIYTIMWFFALFLVLPFHARRAGDTGTAVAGQDAGAPAHFPVARVVVQVSLLTLVIFVAYYVNYVNGWITARDIDIMTWLARRPQ
jgi:predicted secreted protein